VRRRGRQALAEEHTADGVLRAVLNEALGKYPAVKGTTVTWRDLVRDLCRALDQVGSEAADEKEIVRHAVDTAFRDGTPIGPTGFPGLGGERKRFESIVARISVCQEEPPR
jgi:hypothetical protein